MMIANKFINQTNSVFKVHYFHFSRSIIEGRPKVAAAGNTFIWVLHTSLQMGIQWYQCQLFSVCIGPKNTLRPLLANAHQHSIESMAPYIEQIKLKPSSFRFNVDQHPFYRFIATRHL